MRNPNRPNTFCRLSSFVVLLVFTNCIFAQEEKQKTVGAEEKANSETQMDADAKVLLEQVEQAYDKIKTAEFSGEISVNVDMPSDAHKTNQHFSSTFAAPNKFRHQMKDGLVMGSNGGEVYIFNEEANSYLSIDLPSTKVELRSLPIVVPQVLQSQNPSLLFAISKNGIGEVARSFGEIRKGTDLVLGGKNFQVLTFCSGEQESELHLAIDPDTHLIRRFTIDFKPALLEGGATNVQNAEVVVNYTLINSKAEFKESHFAWVPPEGSFNVREPAGATRPEKPVKNMQGVPAPQFRLTTLDGRTISLSQLKGRIVVLDFWATWSTPSAKELPKIAALAERENYGEVQFFAVNLEEDPDKVKTFVELKNINLPVLMDEKGETAKAYEVKTIPQTFVIGKDGIVQEVFIGHSDDREEQIGKAINAAKAKSKN